MHSIKRRYGSPIPPATGSHLGANSSMDGLLPRSPAQGANTNIYCNEETKYVRCLATNGEGARPKGVREAAHQRSTAVPQARPAPKPLSTTSFPGFSRPSLTASSRASGTEPAEVLP